MTAIQLEISIPAPAPAVRSSDTSVAAGKSIEPHLGRLEFLVLYRIASCPTNGLTCDDVECLEGLSHQTVSARIRRLAQLGRIVDSGLRRKTRSGRAAIVWRVAP